MNTLELPYAEILSTNDLIARTKSTDPVEDLDILEYRSKRMFVALLTLEGENQCDYYSAKKLTNPLHVL